MGKRKIVIVCRCLLAGGAEHVIVQLANYLANCDKKCTIITIDDSEVFYSLDPKVKVLPVGKKTENKVFDKIGRYMAVRRLTRKENPDVVLSMPEEIGIYCLLALLGTGIPVYVSERNNPWVMPDVKITRFLRALMYPIAKGIIFQTEMAKSFFPKMIQKKSIVLPNPVDCARIPEHFTGEREKWIAAVGRLETQKNFPLLIRAFQIFSESHPDYQLRIFGEGTQRPELERLIVDLNLKQKVELPGRDAHVLEKIEKAAMFVLSSDYEGMPNVLIEAMCMGMPVIATDCPSGGPKTLVVDGENGLLVPVNDEESLAAAMNKLAEMKYAAELASNAYEMRRKLTDESVFKDWDHFLR